ncbi:MAG: hypothetical protein ACK4SO_08515, partial [Candidatus Kapaibacteriota bacterium]
MCPDFIYNSFLQALNEIGVEKPETKLRFEQPKQEQFGDFATSVALILA